MLTSGVTEVSGDVQVLAGDVVIDVDGRVRIAVEPSEGVLRRAGAEEDAMDVRTPLAALAGAVVTLVVMEGSAMVSEGGTTEAISPGEVRSFGTPKRTVTLPTTPNERMAALQSEIAALQEQLQATEKELATSSFSRALAQGQLEMLQGNESPWPEDAPPSLNPDNFESELRDRVAELEGVEVTRVDCDEYPCVAALRLRDGAELADWNADKGNAVREWIASELGDNHSLSVNASRFKNDDHEARFVLFAAYEGDRDSDVGVRTKYRVDTMLESLGQEVAAELEAQQAPPEE
ncbi:MAG: hypothetical protein AAGA48_28515 [Myxococcota bacterium]